MNLGGSSSAWSASVAKEEVEEEQETNWVLEVESKRVAEDDGDAKIRRPVQAAAVPINGCCNRSIPPL